MSEKEGVDQFRLLLFCMEIPFYRKGIYLKEVRKLGKSIEKTSFPVKTILTDRIEELSVDMLDPESDYRKVKCLIAFNKMILEALF